MTSPEIHEEMKAKVLEVEHRLTIMHFKAMDIEGRNYVRKVLRLTKKHAFKTQELSKAIPPLETHNARIALRQKEFEGAWKEHDDNVRKIEGAYNLERNALLTALEEEKHDTINRLHKKWVR